MQYSEWLYDGKEKVDTLPIQHISYQHLGFVHSVLSIIPLPFNTISFFKKGRCLIPEIQLFFWRDYG